MAGGGPRLAVEAEGTFPTMPERAIQIGELNLIPHRELRRGDATLPIGGRALAVLSELAAAGGELVSKDELFSRVWPNAVVEDNALQAQVSVVRRIMGVEAARLVAVHGRGYRLAIDTEARVPSVAVLPFANLTGDPAMDYLVDGMAEELLVALSRHPELKVPARTSSFAYRDRPIDAKTIARELGVAHLVEGSVRQAEGRLGVNVQLIDGGTGFSTASADFDGVRSDLIDLHARLAEHVAQLLDPALQLTPSVTASAPAHEMVLRARAMVFKLTPAALDEACRLAEAAIALDPTSAPAWEAKAEALHWGLNIGAVAESRTGETLEAAQRAIALDPGRPDPYRVAGAMEVARGDWLEADRQFGLGLTRPAKTPALPEGLALYLLLPLGHLARAGAAMREAIALGPARPQSSQLAAVVAAMSDRPREAEALMDTACLLGFPESRPPRAIVRHLAAMAEGRFEDAGSEIGAMLATQLDDPAAAAVARAAVTGTADLSHRHEAIAALKRLVELGEARGKLWNYGPVAGAFLQMFTALGGLDEAFALGDRIVGRWRERGVLATFPLSPLWLKAMRPFRADPRFQDFARSLNMFDYWERHGPPDGHRLEDGRLVLE